MFVDRVPHDCLLESINFTLSDSKLPRPKELIKAHSTYKVFVFYERTPFLFPLLVMIKPAAKVIV